MRVTVVMSISLLGFIALSGCAPSRYEYEDAERQRERESRAYFQAEERRAAQRARARARAVARARAQAEKERVADQAARSRAAQAPSQDVETQQSNVQQPQAQSEEQVAAVPAKPVTPPAVAAPAVTPERSTSAEPVEARPAADVNEAAHEVGKKQIEDGYRLLRAGFVKKARERFEKAMGSNAPEASLAHGRSMDPSYLKTVAFPDVIPDAEQARRMYRRAILLGNSEAKSDLDRLEKAMAAAAPTSLSPSSPANAEPVGEAPARP